MDFKRVSAAILAITVLLPLTGCGRYIDAVGRKIADYYNEKDNGASTWSIESDLQTETETEFTETEASAEEPVTETEPEATESETTEPVVVGEGHIKTKKKYEASTSTDRVIISMEGTPEEYMVRSEQYDTEGRIVRIEDSELMYTDDVDYLNSHSQSWCRDDKTTYPRSHEVTGSAISEIPADSWALSAKEYQYNDNDDLVSEIGYNSFGDVLFTREYDLANHMAVMYHRASAVESTDGKKYYYHYCEQYDDHWTIQSAALYDPFNEAADSDNFSSGNQIRDLRSNLVITLPQFEINDGKLWQKTINCAGYDATYCDGDFIEKLTTREGMADPPYEVHFIWWAVPEGTRNVVTYWTSYDENGLPWGIIGDRDYDLTGMRKLTFDEFYDRPTYFNDNPNYLTDEKDRLTLYRYHTYALNSRHADPLTMDDFTQIKTNEIRYVYDDDDRLTQTTYGAYKSDGTGEEVIIRYEYNKYGDLTKESYASQLVRNDITYDYQERGYTRYEYTYY